MMKYKYFIQFIDSITNKLSLNEKPINLENVSEETNKLVKKFKEKYKSKMNEVFKFTPKIMMNLLLNFESFDQTTANKDVYMQEEKVVHFNVGYIKLTFLGKLRLTQEKKAKSSKEAPFKTYGVVEDQGRNI